MALVAVGTNKIAGERSDWVLTLPVTDSTDIAANDFLELSSGKLIKSVTTVSTVLKGVAQTSASMGVLANTGIQKYCGSISAGLVIVKGLVEGSGGTYTTDIAVGSKVSFHYDASLGAGSQFVINDATAIIGTVVEGSVTKSGGTDDNWDYVLVEINFRGK